MLTAAIATALLAATSPAQHCGDVDTAGAMTWNVTANHETCRHARWVARRYNNRALKTNLEGRPLQLQTLGTNSRGIPRHLQTPQPDHSVQLGQLSS